VKPDVEAETKADPTGDTPTDGGAVAGATDKFGVPECDDYVERYSKCIAEKVPEASKQQMKDTLATTIKAWKSAADGPAKDGLPTACKAARDAAKSSTSAMGCEW
jgi:hypothetical protein